MNHATRTTAQRSIRAIILSIVVSVACGELNAADVPPDRFASEASDGVAMSPGEHAPARVELDRRMAAAGRQAMRAPGIAGAMCGARVKVIANTPQKVQFAIPQLTGGQVPLSLFVTASPANALTGLRVQPGSGGNTVLVATIAGKQQEVQITWTAVVLVTSWDATPDRTPTAPYLAASPCVQSKSDRISKLADTLWPASGKPAEFAASIQKHILQMKREKQPMSLDALGILASGENSICTANANLAAALMRAKGIPCRSIAAIPLLGARVEMHRTAEYAEGDRWIPFDPSSVSLDVPAKPWHGVVLAKTTVEDEKVSMMPRTSMAPGTPGGQGLDLLTPGMHLTGSDYLWSIAAPLAECEASKEATSTAAQQWARFLETGKLEPTQVGAGSAKTTEEFATRINGG